MALYLTIIFISSLLIFDFNVFLSPSEPLASWWIILLAIVMGVIFQFAVDGLFAIIVKYLPSKWFNEKNKLFHKNNFETRFLNIMKVKKWKEYVWELGGLGGFRKNKILEPQNPQYIQRFIVESNKGVLTHLFGMIMGFSLLFLFPAKYILTISLPIAIVNMFLNILPIMVLRYNTPKLLKLYSLLNKKEVHSLSAQEIDYCDIHESIEQK